MLVLTRREGERVALQDSHGRTFGWMAVASIDGNKVRLGFAFDPDIKIRREEHLAASAGVGVAVAS